jgi:hypothetical protein
MLSARTRLSFMKLAVSSLTCFAAGSGSRVALNAGLKAVVGAVGRVKAEMMENSSASFGLKGATAHAVCRFAPPR